MIVLQRRYLPVILGTLFFAFLLSLPALLFLGHCGMWQNAETLWQSLLFALFFSPFNFDINIVRSEEARRVPHSRAAEPNRAKSSKGSVGESKKEKQKVLNYERDESEGENDSRL